jgi:hypothetical protein
MQEIYLTLKRLFLCLEEMGLFKQEMIHGFIILHKSPMYGVCLLHTRKT